MNRNDFQLLSNLRLREAQALLRLNEYSGAYYLAGYAVECAFKACIAKAIRRYDFPERQQKGKDPYIHDLVQLASLANLKEGIRQVSDADSEFQKNWAVTTLWTEQSRYRVSEQQEAQRLIDAIIERRHGVMPWVKKHW